MVKKGRKPKPKSLHILNGNPSKIDLEKRDKGKPKPVPIAPRCPGWLSKEAKKEWGRCAPILERIGLLTEADGPLFELYCQVYGKWKEAETFIGKNGSTYKYQKLDKDGKVVSTYVTSYPQVAIAKQCADQLLKICSEFGLTPSSRERINLPQAGEDDPLEKWFRDG